MQPRRAAVLVGASDADLRGARIPEEKIRERISRPLPVIGECAPSRLRIYGVEVQAEEVRPEFEMMGAAFHEHVVKELEAAVVPRDERRWVAERAVRPSERNLRVAHVARILRGAQQSDRRREVDALILAGLPAADVQIPESSLVKDRRTERVGVTEGEILRARRHDASKARDE